MTDLSHLHILDASPEGRERAIEAMAREMAVPHAEACGVSVEYVLERMGSGYCEQATIAFDALLSLARPLDGEAVERGADPLCQWLEAVNDAREHPTFDEAFRAALTAIVEGE